MCIRDRRDTIPNVGPNFWAFRGMLAAGGLIILLTFGAFVQNLRNKVTSSRLLLKALPVSYTHLKI